MNKTIVPILAALAVAAATPLPAAAQGWHQVRTFDLKGPGAWDYLSAEPESHRLFVARSTHTMVVNGQTGALIADIPGQQEAHGVALVPAAGRGFISDGGGKGSIVVFDLATYAVLGRLPAMPDVDGIIYDSTDNLVLAVSGRGKTLLSFRPDIDPHKGKPDTVAALHGEPEFLAADTRGRVYINLMTTNEVAVVDLKKRAVVANWPVAPGGNPVGMALDAKTGRIFIGCRGPQKLLVMDTTSGKVLANLPIGKGVDAVKIDAGEIFTSTGDGTLVVVRETSPGKYEIVQTVATHEGARTMTVDPSTHTVYLPTADFEGGAQGGRRRPKPGTFRLLVFRADR
ncbi:MAG: YncE family protein [Proteobacteria bacterium]|nr:YncE family protein [Pseudomonadota bacterium]